MVDESFGDVYFEDLGHFDVKLRCPDDEAPQVYLQIPIVVEGKVINVERCIWIHREALNYLKQIISELERRWEEM